MPISDDLDDWVLENSYGFVGADLAALVRESDEGPLKTPPEIDLMKKQYHLRYWKRWK